MELSGAENTVEFFAENTHTQVQASTITIEYGPASDGAAGAATITMTVNGKADGGDAGNGQITINTGTPYTTAWTFDATTLSLSFSARQTAFSFTEETSTVLTIPASYKHFSVDGLDTYVDFPAHTTTLIVSSASNVIVQLPEVITTLDITAETYMLTVNAYADKANTCNGQSLNGALANSACALGLTTTVILPTGAPNTNLYLNAPGLTTAFTLPGITTTSVLEQGFHS